MRRDHVEHMTNDKPDIDPLTTRLREELEDDGYSMTVWMDADDNVIPHKDWEALGAHGRRLTYDAEGEMVLSETLVPD
jgi:hypothetical protein